MIWVFLMRISLFRRQRDTDSEAEKVPWQATLVVGWAGLRGVVTLATVLLIPDNAATHEVLPVLVFAAMVVTFGTLLLQGLTLPPLVRVLKLRGPDARSDALQAATVLTTSTTAALKALDDLSGAEGQPEAVERVRDRLSSGPSGSGNASATTATARPPPRRTAGSGCRRSRCSATPCSRSGRTAPSTTRSSRRSWTRSTSRSPCSRSPASGPTRSTRPTTTSVTPVDPIGPCEHLEAAPDRGRPRRGRAVPGLRPRGHDPGAPADLPRPAATSAAATPPSAGTPTSTSTPRSTR